MRKIRLFDAACFPIVAAIGRKQTLATNLNERLVSEKADAQHGRFRGNIVSHLGNYPPRGEFARNDFKFRV